MVNAYIRFRANQVNDCGQIHVAESVGGGYMSFMTKNTDGNSRKRIDIANNGDIFTCNYTGSTRTYPIIGGSPIGTANANAGQFNYNDLMGPSGDFGGWVYLGVDYHGAAPWPVKAYKIAQHENGVNGTRVYQIWHDGDANHHHGGLWEVRINEWGSTNGCLLYTSPSPRDATLSRMASSA